MVASLFESSSGNVFCLAQALFFGIGYWKLEDESTDYPVQAGHITVEQLGAVALGSLLFLLGTSTSCAALWDNDDDCSIRPRQPGPRQRIYKTTTPSIVQNY